MNKSISNIKEGINKYFKLKYFTVYIVFTSVIFYLNKEQNLAYAFMVVAFLYLILLNKYKEEYIDGKEE